METFRSTRMCNFNDIFFFKTLVSYRSFRWALSPAKSPVSFLVMWSSHWSLLLPLTTITGFPVNGNAKTWSWIFANMSQWTLWRNCGHVCYHNEMLQYIPGTWVIFKFKSLFRKPSNKVNRGLRSFWNSNFSLPTP